tara:strand:- start:323 stop:556 length:234 start_codon:yes stop_codon:yes gene_type:complete
MRKTKGKPSRSTKLLVHLLKGKTINGRQALTKFGIYRLSAVIHGFRKRGFEIETKMIARNDTKYGVYKMLSQAVPSV